MTDANTEFERDAVRQLVQPLRDEEVGLVCGRLRLHSPAGAPLPAGTVVDDFVAAAGTRVGAQGLLRT